jgi:hypothetical protein
MAIIKPNNSQKWFLEYSVEEVGGSAAAFAALFFSMIVNSKVNSIALQYITGIV